jgi:hypothetical protein
LAGSIWFRTLDATDQVSGWLRSRTLLMADYQAYVIICNAVKPLKCLELRKSSMSGSAQR